MLPIQKPFADAENWDIEVHGRDLWTPEEHELLLRGVAAGQTFAEIAADITDELNNRTAKACEMEFHRIAVKVRKST